MWNGFIFLHENVSKLVPRCQFPGITTISNSSVRVFHIEKGVSLPCKFKTMWYLTTSKMILLPFAVSLFHRANYCASNIVGFGMSVLLYSNTPLSLSTTSIMSFQAMKFEVFSRAYSNLNLLKYILLHGRKPTSLNLQIEISNVEDIWTSFYCEFHPDTM